MLGSSYRFVRTSNDSSDMLVQSRATLPILSSPTMIVLVCCSLTSRGLDDYAFNHSVAI